MVAQDLAAHSFHFRSSNYTSNYLPNQNLAFLDPLEILRDRGLMHRGKDQQSREYQLWEFYVRTIDCIFFVESTRGLDWSNGVLSRISFHSLNSVSNS